MDFIMQYDKATKSFFGDNILLSQGEIGANTLKISKKFADDDTTEVYIEFYLPKGIRTVSDKLSLVGDYYELVLPEIVTAQYGTASFQAVGYRGGIIVKSAMIYDKIEILQSVNATKAVKPNVKGIIDTLLMENSQQNAQILEQSIGIGAINVKIDEHAGAISGNIAAVANANEKVALHESELKRQAEKLNAHESEINRHAEKLTANETAISNCAGVAANNGNRLSQLSAAVTAQNNLIRNHAQSIENIETSVDGKQAKRVLVYDKYSSDSALNWGKPNGIEKNNVITNKNLSSYNKLYCTIIFENHNVNTIVEVDLNTPYRDEYIGSNCGFYMADATMMLLMGAVVKTNAAKSDIWLTTSYILLNPTAKSINDAGSPKAFIYRIEAEIK